MPKKLEQTILRWGEIGVRTGPWGVTLFIVCFSLLIYTIIAFLFGLQEFWTGYIIATIMPLIVAYPLSIGLMMIARIFKAQRENIEFSNNLKNTLLSVVSHDVKGPLSNIDAVLNLYFSEEIKEEEREELLRELQQQVKTNLDFVIHILHWTKMQFDGFKLTKTTFNLEDVISKMLLAYDFQLQQKKIKISHQANMIITADRDLVRLVLRNLLSNAIKFSNPGGTIHIKAENNGTLATIQVEDNGIGMNEEKSKRIFEETFTSSAQGTWKESGTGLGLKLCKTFIEAQGGVISVKSKLGVGSTFFFTVPQ